MNRLGAVLALMGGAASAAWAAADGPVTVTTLAEFEAAVAGQRHHIVVDGTLDGGPCLRTLTFADTGWNHTVIEGAPGGRAALVNLQLKFDGELLAPGTNLDDLTVKNLTFHGRIADLQALPPQVYGTAENAGVNYEGLSFRRCTDVVVEHCTIYDTSDDLMSVALAIDRVRISYCHLFFSEDWVSMDPDPQWNWVGAFHPLSGERLALVVGANTDHDSYAVHHGLRVTLDHNWVGPRIRGRPLLRGLVHVYNNLFDSATGAQKDQYNALQVGGGGVVYAEANVFWRTHNSTVVGLDHPYDRWGYYERNNRYLDTTGTVLSPYPWSGDQAFDGEVPDAVDTVADEVRAQAGPR